MQNGRRGLKLLKLIQVIQVIEALSGMLKRALPQAGKSGLVSQIKCQNMAGTSAQSEAVTGLASMVDDLDKLIVQEDGELDETEDKL